MPPKCVMSAHKKPRTLKDWFGSAPTSLVPNLVPASTSNVTYAELVAQRTGVHVASSNPTDHIDVAGDGTCEDVCYARGQRGPVDAAKWTDDDGLLSCYACGSEMCHVRQRSRVRGGVTFIVRAHFRHKSAPSCGNTGESAEHQAAIDAFRFHAFTYQWVCRRCKKVADLEIPGTAAIEQAWTHDGRRYRLDVGFMSQGTVVGAVEVWHTHQTVGQKLQDLIASGLAWCEVRAADVHAAIRRGDFCLRAIVCAFDVCPSCIARDVEAGKSKLLAAHQESIRQLRTAVLSADATLSNFREDFDQIESELRAELSKTQEACEIIRRRITGIRSDANVNMLTGIIEWATEQLEFPAEVDMAHFNEIVTEPELILTFGKHRGLHINRLWEARDPYIVWIAGFKYNAFEGNRPVPTQTDHQPSGAQRQRARELLTGHCYVCFEPVNADWKKRCPDCYRTSRGY
jgi:hypothetical protein